MDRLHRLLILGLIAGMPAAAMPFLPAAVPLCFTAGAVTYQLSASAAAPDIRVRFDDATRSDLRIGLVNDVAVADFALVDDVAGTDNACHAATALKTIRIVDGAADLAIHLAQDPAGADFTLFVHSGRFNHRDAAALFAVLQRDRTAATASDPAAD
jgi:hypothetical protein